jgi:hypothetical protein
MHGRRCQRGFLSLKGGGAIYLSCLMVEANYSLRTSGVFTRKLHQKTQRGIKMKKSQRANHGQIFSRRSAAVRSLAYSQPGYVQFRRLVTVKVRSIIEP